MRTQIALALMRAETWRSGFVEKFDRFHRAIDIEKYDEAVWLEIYRQEFGAFAKSAEQKIPKAIVQIESDLLSFFADRLKGQLREQGARHDLVDAVFAAGAGALPSPLRGGVGGGGQQATTQDTPTPDLRSDPPRKGEGGAADAAPMQDDLLLVVRRVEALAKFLDTDDGKNLLAGVKRASNILAIEEKKDKRSFDGAPDAGLYALDAEKALAAAIVPAARDAAAAVANEDFAAAMSAMAKLRAPVDAFFDGVKVNDADPNIRENRLRLLNEIRAATRAVADFSKIAE